VGVLWSNQAIQRFGFRTHADGDPVDAWSTDEVPPGLGDAFALPVSGGFADDHLNLATADGRLYAAVKTSYDLVEHPVLLLLVRDADGTWQPADAAHRIDLDEVEATRPVVTVLGDQLVVAYTDRRGQDTIRYRMTALDPIAFGPEQVAVRADAVDDVTSTDQVATSEAIFVASDAQRAYGVTMTPTP
jgi:hypothetical protein